MFEFFQRFSGEIYVFLLSMVPVIELRGAIPLGYSLGLDPLTVYITAVLGNSIPVPFIIFFARPIFKFLKRFSLTRKFIEWLETRSIRKSAKIAKLSAFGLFLFVAVPLPGTGAWTGAIIAALLDLRYKYALPSVILGVVAAGIIMTSGSEIFMVMKNLIVN